MFHFNGFPFWFIGMVVLLIFCFATLSAAAVVANPKANQDETQEFEKIRAQAEADAKADGGGTTGYGIGGFLCGIIGYLIAATSDPVIPPERLVGKDATYVEVYSNAYKQKVKKMRKSAACTGWVLGTTVGLVINLATLSNAN